MITTKVWGHEDTIAAGQSSCKKIVMYDGHCTSTHTHGSKEEVIFVFSGLILILSGKTPDKMVGSWLKDNDRISIPSNQYHRIVALRDSSLIEFSVNNSEDEEKIESEGGKISQTEYTTLLSQFYKQENRSKVLSIQEAEIISKTYHSEGRTVGLVSGFFDILHLGHLELLTRAKSICDVLFVAINLDSGIKERKGKNRPFIEEAARILTVESIRYVDYVVQCPNQTCEEAVDAIRPNIYIISSDLEQTSIEAKKVKTIGGTVHIIETLKGYSSSSIANSIAIKLSQ